MTSRLYLNNAETLTVTSMTTGSTAVNITVGDGALFNPGTGQIIVATLTDGISIEVIHITDAVGDVLTITRAQDSTTAVAWPAGTRLEARITAEMLTSIDPLKYSLGFSGYTLEHATSLALKAILKGLAGANQASITVASTVGAQIGYDLVGAIGTILGNDITTTNADADSVSIGNGVTNAGDKTVAIGSDITVDSLSTRAVVIGSLARTTGSPSIVVIGYNAEGNVDADLSVVLGDGARALSRSAVSLGNDAVVTQNANGGTAVGCFSRISNDASSATAVGYGATAYAPSSTAIGTYSEAWLEGALSSVNVPAVQRDQGYFLSSATAAWSTSWPAVIASPPMDLATGGVWASGAVYKDNDVVKPLTPVPAGTGTEQFYLVMGSSFYPDLADTPIESHPYNGSAAVVNQITEGVTQPTWATATTNQGDSVATAVSAVHKWHYVDPEVGVNLGVDIIDQVAFAGGKVMFYPTRIGFICHKYVTNTAAPYVSVGNQTSATEYVNNVQLSDIAADNEVHWLTVAGNAGATNLVFTLETKGTGASSRMTGRFVVEGIYIQLPG